MPIDKAMRTREERCGTWWNGETETERFILYYMCLRIHYELQATEALQTAKRNWRNFGPNGQFLNMIREAIRKGTNGK
jgi:hypothetical protein